MFSNTTARVLQHMCRAHRLAWAIVCGAFYFLGALALWVGFLYPTALQLARVSFFPWPKDGHAPLIPNSIPGGKSPIIILLFSAIWLVAEAQQCRPSGKIRGRKAPPGQCNQENDSDCCKPGKMYPTYTCSPPLSGSTKATLTLNSFEKGGDGGGPSECDNQNHNDNTPVVALSTGWYSNGDRCHKHIRINGNECDSTGGCDADHDYQPPCPNNIVDASKAVWKALGVPEDQWGGLDITWSEA